jgi:hypothetical protein
MRDLWLVFVSGGQLPAGMVIGLVPAALATAVEVPRIAASFWPNIRLSSGCN